MTSVSTTGASPAMTISPNIGDVLINLDGYATRQNISMGGWTRSETNNIWPNIGNNQLVTTNPWQTTNEITAFRMDLPGNFNYCVVNVGRGHRDLSGPLVSPSNAQLVGTNPFSYAIPSAGFYGDAYRSYCWFVPETGVNDAQDVIPPPPQQTEILNYGVPRLCNVKVTTTSPSYFVIWRTWPDGTFSSQSQGFNSEPGIVSYTLAYFA